MRVVEVSFADHSSRIRMKASGEYMRVGENS